MYRFVLFTLFILAATPGTAQQSRPPADPTKGFDPSTTILVRNASRNTQSAPILLTRTIEASTVIPLPDEGHLEGGVDRGLINAGIIFGARIFGQSGPDSIELFYYIPSAPDNYYREGDYRASTGRIGSTAGVDQGGYYCPEGYALVGFEGVNNGLGIPQLQFICGKIGDLSRVAPLPAAGHPGGTTFKHICDKTYSTGFLTGVRLRTGLWLDSIQGFCQARNPPAETSAAVK